MTTLTDVRASTHISGPRYRRRPARGLLLRSNWWLWLFLSTFGGGMVVLFLTAYNAASTA